MTAPAPTDENWPLRVIERAMDAMTPEEFADFRERIQPILRRAEKRQAKEAAR